MCAAEAPQEAGTAEAAAEELKEAEKKKKKKKKKKGGAAGMRLVLLSTALQNSGPEVHFRQAVGRCAVMSSEA